MIENRFYRVKNIALEKIYHLTLSIMLIFKEYLKYCSSFFNIKYI